MMMYNPEFSKGSITKSLFYLALPIIFVNLLQMSYQLIDTFWVGRLGTEAVAAVSITFPVITSIISLCSGFSMAGTILVAQFKGKNDKESIGYISAQTILIALIVSLVLATVGYIFSPYLISLMGAQQIIFLDAVSYMRMSFIGFFFVFTYSVFQSLMRGIGEVKLPAYIVLFTVILNIVFDPLFIFGYGIIPGNGVSGAALATIVTQSIASIIGITILFKGTWGIKIDIKDFKPDYKLIKNIFYLGLPASIDQSTRHLEMTVITFIVAGFGTIALAAYGVGIKMVTLIIVPAMGLSMATMTLVGQNIGAGNQNIVERITKISSFINFVLLATMGIIFFVFAGRIAWIFIPGEIETIKETMVFIRIVALSFGFVGIQQTLIGTFRGAGDTVAAMLIAVVSLWVVEFPLAYSLSKYASDGLTGLWFAFPITNIIVTVVAWFWYYKGDWRNKRIMSSFQNNREF